MLLVEQSWAQVHTSNEICIFHLPTAPVAQTKMYVLLLEKDEQK